MGEEKIDIEKNFDHWIKTSDKDFDTMNHLFEAKDYHWALFLGHLVIERLLKAGIVKATAAHPPFSHDLRRLARLSEIKFKSIQLGWFDTLTTFNLNARYDSYKQAFYEKCTVEYTTKWISNIEELRLWIKLQL